MSTPLRDLIVSLQVDPGSQAAFAADPAAFLDQHGWGDLDGLDVGTALAALAAEAPIEQATRLDEVAADTDGLDGGLAGAITGLGAAAEALREAPALGLDHLADPDVALDNPEPPTNGDAPYDGDPTLGIDEGGTADAGTANSDTTSVDEADHDDLDGVGDDTGLDHDPTLAVEGGDEPGGGSEPAGELDDDAIDSESSVLVDEPADAEVQDEPADGGGADDVGDQSDDASLLDADPFEGLDPLDGDEPWADVSAEDDDVGDEPDAETETDDGM